MVLDASGGPVLDGHKLVGKDWLYPDPLSSSVRFKRTIEASVVTIGSMGNVALDAMVNAVVEGGCD